MKCATRPTLRPAYASLGTWLRDVEAHALARRRDEAEIIFRRRGITFAVYGDTSGAERLIPFDVIPRILARSEWDQLARGCIQRVTALSAYTAILPILMLNDSQTGK